MGFFVPHLLFWISVHVVFDPGVIKIQIQNAPAVVYDKNDGSWAIPVYEESKHFIKCIQDNNINCLKGNK